MQLYILVEGLTVSAPDRRHDICYKFVDLLGTAAHIEPRVQGGVQVHMLECLVGPQPVHEIVGPTLLLDLSGGLLGMPPNGLV